MFRAGTCSRHGGHTECQLRLQCACTRCASDSKLLFLRPRVSCDFLGCSNCSRTWHVWLDQSFFFQIPLTTILIGFQQHFLRTAGTAETRRHVLRRGPRSFCFRADDEVSRFRVSCSTFVASELIQDLTEATSDH